MEGELQGEVLDSENEVGLPEPLVGLVGQVGPGDRRQGGYEQEQGAETGLGHRGDLLGDGVTPTWTNRTLSRRAVDRGGLRGSAPSTTISERKGRSLPLRLDTAVGGPQGNERREAPRHSRRPPKKKRGGGRTPAPSHPESRGLREPWPGACRRLAPVPPSTSPDRRAAARW